MSSLIVDICTIDSIRPHPNADKLSIATVKGWNVIFNHEIEHYHIGQRVCYVPPDTLVPLALATKLGIENYLSFNKRYEGYGRTKQIKLRGEMSYGFLMKNEFGLNVGDSVVDIYGFQKWEPPPPPFNPFEKPKLNWWQKKLSKLLSRIGIQWPKTESMKSPPSFQMFTDIENYRNFPNVFIEGEEVIVTEKIHGTCSRTAYVDKKLVVGSRRVRKHPKSGSVHTQHLEKYPQIQEMLKYIGRDGGTIILFGEIYGRVQDLRYGEELAFAAFDISTNGTYLPYNDFECICSVYNIPTVPILYRGPFNKDHIWSLASGLTTMMKNPSKKDLREGVVVRPIVERTDPKLGRVILKFISDEYLNRKGGTENH